MNMPERLTPQAAAIELQAAATTFLQDGNGTVQKERTVEISPPDPLTGVDAVTVLRWVDNDWSDCDVNYSISARAKTTEVASFIMSITPTENTQTTLAPSKTSVVSGSFYSSIEFIETAGGSSGSSTPERASALARYLFSIS